MDLTLEPSAVPALAIAPEMGSAMLQLAEAGAAYGAAIAPVLTGAYHARFSASPATVTSPSVGQAAGAVVANSDPAAAAIEWRDRKFTLSEVAAAIENGVA